MNQAWQVVSIESSSVTGVSYHPVASYWVPTMCKTGFWDRLVKDRFELVDCHVFPCFGKELKQWLWVALTSFLKATIPGLQLRAKFVKLFHNRSDSNCLKLCRSGSLSPSHFLWSWIALKAVKYKPQISERGCVQELWWHVNALSRGNSSISRGHCNMVSYGLWRGWWGMI